MKKSILLFSMIIFLCGLNFVKAQEQPKPKKDTVNMDTEAKPQFYYAVEDEKSKGANVTTIALIAGGVVVVGGAGIYFLRKKK